MSELTTCKCFFEPFISWPSEIQGW